MFNRSVIIAAVLATSTISVVNAKACSTAVLNGWMGDQCTGDPAMSDLKLATDGTCVSLSVGGMAASGLIDLNADGTFDAKVWLGNGCGGASHASALAHVPKVHENTCISKNAGIVTLAINLQCSETATAFVSTPTATVVAPSSCPAGESLTTGTDGGASIECCRTDHLYNMGTHKYCCPNMPTADAWHKGNPNHCDKTPPATSTAIVASPTPTPSSSSSPSSSPTPSSSPVLYASSTPSVSVSAAPSTTPSTSAAPSATPSTTPSTIPSTTPSAAPSATPSVTPPATRSKSAVSAKACSTAVLNGWMGDQCTGAPAMRDLKVATDGTCVSLNVGGMAASGLIDLNADGTFDAKVWLGNGCGGASHASALAHVPTVHENRCISKNAGIVTLAINLQCSESATAFVSTPTATVVAPSSCPPGEALTTGTDGGATIECCRTDYLYDMGTHKYCCPNKPTADAWHRGHPNHCDKTPPATTTADVAATTTTIVASSTPTPSSSPVPSASSTASVSAAPTTTPSTSVAPSTIPSATPSATPSTSEAAQQAVTKSGACASGESITNGDNKCCKFDHQYEMGVHKYCCINKATEDRWTKGRFNGCDKTEPTTTTSNTATTTTATVAKPSVTPTPSAAPSASSTPSSSPVTSASTTPSVSSAPSASPSTSRHPSTTPSASKVGPSKTPTPSVTPSASASEATPSTTTTSTLAAQTPTSTVAVASTSAIVAPVQSVVVQAVLTPQTIATETVESFVTTCAERFPGETTSTQACCRWGDNKCVGLTKCNLRKCIAGAAHNTIATTQQTVQRTQNERVCGDMFNDSDIEANKPCCRWGHGACAHLTKCTRTLCTKARQASPAGVNSKAHTSTLSATNEITCAEKKALDVGSLQCDVYETKQCCRHSGDCGDLAKCQTKNCCRD